MASSTHEVLAVAADAAGSGGSSSAAAGQVGMGTAALIALCTSVAAFGLQFILRTIALGRWQGQIESRVDASEQRASERHDELIAAVQSAEGRQQKALENLETRYVRQRDELMTEIRSLRTAIERK